MPGRFVLPFVLLCSAMAAADASAQQSPKPNIILIVIDDFGWADLGCYGSTYHETPNLDALARCGMRFTDAYAACPVCSPSRAAIMTGKYPRGCTSPTGCRAGPTVRRRSCSDR